MTDTRKYFHWDKSALRDECIKQAEEISRLKAENERLKQAGTNTSLVLRFMSQQSHITPANIEAMTKCRENWNKALSGEREEG